MPALNFPSTPAINDTFSASGVIYTWDGQRWLASVSSGATGATGPGGQLGATGSTGVVGGPTYVVTNSGASSYTINGSANPALNLLRGFTYYFSVSASGHPFWIKTAQVTGTGSAYSSGVTNNGVDTGVVSFQVPLDAPSTLYYICQFHGSMTGTLNISDLGPTGATGATGIPGATGSTPNFILELSNTLTAATGVVAHNYNLGGVYIHTSIASNFTANFTNVPTTTGAVVNFTLVLNQGATPYMVTAVQIDGQAQTIKWVENVVPSGNANKTDLVSFNLLRISGSWVVLGSLSSFG